MLVLLTIMLSMQAAAESNFVNADGSDLSELCIAATQSRQKMQLVADELGLAPVNQATLACNDMPLHEFVKTYRDNVTNDVALYLFQKNDETMETELCYAAVTSLARYQSLKEAYLIGRNQEEQILCNRTPIKRFMQRYHQRENRGIAALMQ